MDAQQKRGKNWTQEEIKDLLRIWKEPDIREAIGQPSNRKKVVWEQIAVLLHDAGHQVRKGDKIHQKIKDLKGLHRALHDTLNTSGGGAEAMKNPYWADLQDLLGGRANVRPPAGSVGASMDIEESEDDEEGHEGATDMDDSGVFQDPEEAGEAGVRPNELDDPNDAVVQPGVGRGQDEVAEQRDQREDEEIQEPQQAEEGQEEGRQQGVQQAQVAQAQIAQPPKAANKGQKRQRETKKEQTVNALAKKLKDMHSASDRRFAEMERLKMEEARERRDEHRNVLTGVLRAIEDGNEGRRRSEDRRSDEFKAFMTSFMTVMAPGHNQQFPHGPTAQLHHGHNQQFPHGPTAQLPHGQSHGPPAQFPHGHRQHLPHGPNQQLIQGHSQQVPHGYYQHQLPNRAPAATGVYRPQAEDRAPAATGVYRPQAEDRAPAATGVYRPQAEDRAPAATGVYRPQAEDRVPAATGVYRPQAEDRAQAATGVYRPQAEGDEQSQAPGAHHTYKNL